MAVGRRGERAPLHDRGRVLVHALLVLAAGGEACSNIEYLRAQPELFGDTASDSTLWRAVTGLGADGPGALAGAAACYKGGYGFCPMVCSVSNGEPLWVKLRPGNAAANDISDHLEVIDAAVSVLPDADAAGHRDGDDPNLVERPLVARIDAAGCSAALAAGLRGRNTGFMVTARSTDKITAAAAKSLADAGLWEPAQAGPQRRRRRRGAAGADLTHLADLSGWPAGTRLVVRREPLHPGAQHSLFPSENHRYHGFHTDQKGRPARLDKQTRSHADIENAICRLKDSGLARMPFADWHANHTWAALAAVGLMLVGWFQNACLTGQLAKAAPKRLRRQLWHLPALACRTGGQTSLRQPQQHPGARALPATAHPR